MFRKTFLVLLALLGFSALCCADPVLMAHRYGREQLPFEVALPECAPSLRPQIKEKTPESPTGGTATGLEMTGPHGSFAFQIQTYTYAVDAFEDVTSALFCSTTSSD